MPVIFNEPLSFLQRLTEYMEHTYLIHQANTVPDSVERMKVERPVTFWKFVQSAKIILNAVLFKLRVPLSSVCIILSV